MLDIAILDLLKTHRVSEDEVVLRIYNVVCSKNNFLVFQQFHRYIIDNNLGVLSVIDNFGGFIDIEQGYNDQYLSLDVMVKLDKNNQNSFCFITSKAFEEYLLKNNELHNVIHLGFISQGFHTELVSFLPIGVESNNIKNKPSIQAINHTKPLNEYAQKFLPVNLLQWINIEDDNSGYDKSWINKSTLKILCTICNEFLVDQQLLELFFRGERRKSIKIDTENAKLLESINGTITKVAKWIFLLNNDIDSRHTIFNYQLSSLLRDISSHASNDLDALFNTALTNSILAYKYHLYNSSKELNKILSDLNKSLYDYTVRIKQNTADLINTMWRDFIAIFSLLILNFAIKKPDLPEVYYLIVGVVVSMYLAFNFLLSSKVHFWFYKNLNETLIDWKPKIYGYLTDKEYQTYAINPLRSSQERFEIVFYTLIIAYEFLIIIFLFSILDGISVVRFFCFLNGMKS